MGTAPEERRKYERVTLNISAQYRLTDSSIESFMTTVLNISQVGLCFLTGRELKAKTRVDFMVQLDDEKAVLRGEVIWSRSPDQGHRFQNGIKIIEMAKEDRDRFDRFLKKKIPKPPLDLR
jgi:c-di-GMP-binding flagellar brake protein YcgR